MSDEQSPPSLRIVQKNALFAELTQRGLDPADFGFNGPTVATILNSSYSRYRVTGPPPPVHPLNTREPPVFIFAIRSEAYDVFDGPYLVAYRPHPTMDHCRDDDVNWGDVLEHFGRWSAAVVAQRTPDRWEEVRQSRAIAASIVAEYDTPFTPREIQRIGTSFDEAQAEITQKRLLSADDLIDLSARMLAQRHSAPSTGRIEWQKTAAQEWFKWVIRRGLESGVAQQVLDIISSKFAWLSHHLSQAGALLHKFLPP